MAGGTTESKREIKIRSKWEQGKRGQFRTCGVCNTVDLVGAAGNQLNSTEVQ